MAKPEDTLTLETTKGNVVIEMLPDLAPGHVARIKELVKDGFYDVIVFHRVIDGFMAQTGCPHGTGTGGSGKKLKAEFNREPHVRGLGAVEHGLDVGEGHDLRAGHHSGRAFSFERADPCEELPRRVERERDRSTGAEQRRVGSIRHIDGRMIVAQVPIDAEFASPIGVDIDDRRFHLERLGLHIQRGDELLGLPV